LSIAEEHLELSAPDLLSTVGGAKRGGGRWFVEDLPKQYAGCDVSAGRYNTG